VSDRWLGMSLGVGLKDREWGVEWRVCVVGYVDVVGEVVVVYSQAEKVGATFRRVLAGKSAM
jgi:hypothetical protein